MARAGPGSRLSPLGIARTAPSAAVGAPRSGSSLLSQVTAVFLLRCDLQRKQRKTNCCHGAHPSTSAVMYCVTRFSWWLWRVVAVVVELRWWLWATCRLCRHRQLVTPTFRCAYVRSAHVCVRVGVPVVLLLFAIFFVFVSTPKASPPGGLTPCDQYFTEAGMCTVEDYARNVTQATSLFVSEQPVPYCCGLSCAKPSYTGNVPAELLYNSFCATPGAVDTDGQCPAHGCTTTLFPDWYEGLWFAADAVFS